MALVVGMFVLYGVSFAVAYASFVLARYLAGSAFRVSDRVAPFGEASPAGFEGARPGARLAVTLAGPLGVYVFAAFLSTLGLLLGANPIGVGTTITGFVANSPAASAGLQEGDRFKVVAGRQVAVPDDLKAVLASTDETVIDVVVERNSQEVRFQVPVPAGEKRRFGVQLGPNNDPVGVGRAFRAGIEYPWDVVAGGVNALMSEATVAVAGPVGVMTVTAGQPKFGDRLRTLSAVQSIGLVFFVLGSFALWPPRAPRRTETAGTGTAPPPVDGGEAVGRPGARFVARAVDWTLLGFILTLAAPVATALLPIAWFPIEAGLLSRWGFTPGKWLLGIAVRDAHGGRLTFRAAFHRTAAVWAYGVGAYTPFALATGVLAYADLKHNKTTYWDTLGGNTVQHLPVGEARRAVAVIALLAGVVATFLVAD